MDYYYALLENYDQLKRRKFKLSLREEEAQEGEDNKADDAARQAADAAFKAAQEVKPEAREALAKSDELTFVKKAGDASKTSALGGPFKSAPMKSVGSLDELDDKTLAKVVGYFKDKEGGGDGEGGDDPNAQQVDPAQQSEGRWLGGIQGESPLCHVVGSIQGPGILAPLVRPCFVVCKP